MNDWNYERPKRTFEPLPVGQYRLRIREAKKSKSKSGGNDMLEITFDVSGSNQILYHYITFLPKTPEVTNRMLTALFDSFGIADGDFNLEGWKGKVGGCQTKMEEYNGEDRAKISYFLSKKQQVSLPPWKDGAEKNTTAHKPEVVDVTDEELPF